MKSALFCLLTLVLISGCAAQRQAAVPIQGLEAFQQVCADLPPVFSEADALAVAHAVEAALALDMPEREKALSQALRPLSQRDQANRGCALYERRRADGLLALGGRFNQEVARVNAERGD